MITQSVLKIIALISMLIDHLGVGILKAANLYGYDEIPWVQALCIVMRGIGRTALPIYGFLITEGFFHTKSRKKYLLRLLLFCFISEFPFDYLFNWHLSDFRLMFIAQNVFFTLAIGLAVLIINDILWDRMTYCRKGYILPDIILQFGVCFFGGKLAYLIRSDYGAMGVWLIAMIYYARKLGNACGLRRDSTGRLQLADQPSSEKRNEQKPDNILTDARRYEFLFAALAIAIWLVWSDLLDGSFYECMGIPAVLLIALYSGQKGHSSLPRKFFYWFYPAHILLIGIVFHLLSEQSLYNTVNELMK